MWPPPSPPWIITASAPQPATFSAWRARPTLGITTRPWSLSLAISSFFGASANDATLTPCLISRSTRCGSVAGVGAQVDPERLVGAALHLEDRVLELVVRHRRAGQDAEPTGVGGADDQTRAGDPAHAGLHDGVAYAGQLGQRRPEQLVDHARLYRGPRGRAASSGRASRGSASARRGRARGSRARRRQRGSRTRTPPAPRSTVTPGCTETNCIVWPGPSKSKTPRSLTTRCTWWKRVAAAPAASARVRPDTGDDVDLLDEDPAWSASAPSRRSCC